MKDILMTAIVVVGAILMLLAAQWPTYVIRMRIITACEQRGGLPFQTDDEAIKCTSPLLK